MQSTQTKNSRWMMAAVLSVFVAGQTPVIINPALNGLAKIFSDVPYSQVLLLSTLVSLFTMVFSIISGNIAGKKVSFKNLTILAIVLIVIGGVVPIFMTNFYMVLCMRAIVGIGIGLVIPLGNALIFRLYKGKQQVNLQGISTLVMNISGMVFQYLAGFVSAINPVYVWLVYLVLLIPLVLVVIFLEEPAPVAQPKDVPAEKPHVKLPAAAYIISLGYAINFIFIYPLMLNMASLLENDNLGTATTAGTVLALYTLGGMLAGAAFGVIFQKLGKAMTAFSFGLEVIGFCLVAFTNSVFLIACGALIVGFAVFTLFPTCMVDFSAIMPQDVLAKASGLFMAGMNLGAFCASGYIGILGKIRPDASPRFILMISAAGALILGIVWTAGRLAMYRNHSAQQSQK